jgi:hypothetical protein
LVVQENEQIIPPQRTQIKRKNGHCETTKIKNYFTTENSENAREKKRKTGLWIKA